MITYNSKTLKLNLNRSHWYKINLNSYLIIKIKKANTNTHTWEYTTSLKIAIECWWVLLMQHRKYSPKETIIVGSIINYYPAIIEHWASIPQLKSLISN